MIDAFKGFLNMLEFRWYGMKGVLSVKVDNGRWLLISNLKALMWWLCCLSQVLGCFRVWRHSAMAVYATVPDRYNCSVAAAAFEAVVLGC